jgi:tRNA/tmRNA/rRNA uracil-C5-methylase (TrmA/RlmC/RlmD family)
VGATPSPLQYGYRHRCRIHLHRGKAGFLAAGSHDVVDAGRCLLLAEPLNRLLPVLASIFTRGTREEAHLLTDGERALAYLPGRKHDCGVARLLLRAGLAGVRFSDRTEGDSSLPLPVTGMPLRASAGAFVQANRKGNDLLVGRIRQLLAAAPVSHLLDLYAGGGNFSLPLSALAERVTAVESGADSFRDLQANRDALSIRNCRLVQAPVESYRPEEPPDAVLVDPPRSGLSAKALGTLRAASPGRIFYISCDPATLARDLRALADRYDLASVELFDFFPQAPHVETLALLLPR